jgi:hypothetical protein
MVKSLTGEPLSNFLPGQSDAIGYYTEINTAVNVGVFSKSAGYNGYMWNRDELTIAKSLFYGGHGLFVLLPYIFFGKIIGWGGASPLVIHLILLTISFIFIYFCTASVKKAIIVQVICFLFVPLFSYFLALMMEIEMYAWGIILAALTYSYVKRSNRTTCMGLLIGVVLASSAKITNIVFIIPFFILTIKEYLPIQIKKPLSHSVATVQGRSKNTGVCASFNKNAKAMYGVIFIFAIAVLFYIDTRLTVRYNPDFRLSLLYSLNTPKEALQLFTNHFNNSFKAYFNPNTNLFFVYLRYCVFGFAMLLIVYTFLTYDAENNKWRIRFNIEPLFLSLILLIIALLNIMFYDVFNWRDFRVMAPIFLSVVVYCVISYEKLLIPTCFGIALCLVSLIFLNNPISVIPAHFAELPQKEYTRYLRYDAYAKSRFDNTMIVSKVNIGAFDITAGLGAIYDMTGGNFSFEKMAEYGVKYILVPNYDGITDGYNLLASGEGWQLWVLKLE